MDKKLILIDGLDASGKSTYAKMLQEKLVKEYGIGSWIYQHEPTFTSEEADELNFNRIDVWRREYYFMKDRINHQKILRENNVVLDRYIFSGLAYAQTFSPEVVPMMTSIYSNPNEFVQPNATFFIDMDPINAMAINESRTGLPDYNPKLTLDILQKLRIGFLKHIRTMEEWGQPVFTIQPFFGDIDRTFDLILSILKTHPII